jgi:serine/threonine protein kinase
MSQTDHPAPPDCGGRFAIQSFLGAGGMGSVYEAYDHKRQSQVAIKVMRRSSAPWIYSLKKEFRSLAGIVHPNLVTLHELIEWEDQWLFTMERVPGVSFSQARRAGALFPVTAPVPSAADGPDAPTIASHTSRPPEMLFSDIDRVRDALRQLCDGLDFLHGLGLAHGDVKPANVLVTPDGRVVILDFGILRDWRSDEEDDPQSVFGTPAYLAPERLYGSAADPASDMFAVGVILFEVLTGRDLERDSDPESILRASRVVGPETNSTLTQRKVMEDLCLRLMDPDPGARPTATQVMDAVVSGAAQTARPGAIRLARGLEELPFVAREAELEMIRNTVLDRRPLAPRVVIVSGESGIGKTEPMRRIVDEQLPASCIVLEGKCYEREHVAYRAMDRVVDSLSSKLLAVDQEQLEALAWADLAVVSRMFPVLRRVPEIDRLCGRNSGTDTRDPREQRRAAAAILGRMLALVASGRRVILYIDDLHWGDEESGIVLRDLFKAA